MIFFILKCSATVEGGKAGISFKLSASWKVRDQLRDRENPGEAARPPPTLPSPQIPTFKIEHFSHNKQISSISQNLWNVNSL
jgi:hypothetical protein